MFTQVCEAFVNHANNKANNNAEEPAEETSQYVVVTWLCFYSSSSTPLGQRGTTASERVPSFKALGGYRFGGPPHDCCPSLNIFSFYFCLFLFKRRGEIFFNKSNCILYGICLFVLCLCRCGCGFAYQKCL